ncbi:SsgA family sporulation/cell division regulator [Nocardioides insulae]|uniref:SsgA family sporulation/cell division regulator n=1 Tax=Nocardioides insulae TaxID=394734 RepID=UPI001FDFD0D7|nr:SsgA family sporulation/cell division regulator [Nocardioides insulae]
MDTSPMTPALSQRISLWCLDPWGRQVAVPTTLGYSSEDPYAISFTFHSGKDDVEWIVARNLLLQGLTGPVGEGDVRIYPSIDEDAHAVTILDFHSPDGRLVAEANTRQLQKFLTRTFGLVPVGSESEYVDLDTLIDGLLSSSNSE